MPENPISLKSIIQTAIEREIEARELYTEAAQHVEDTQAQALLQDLAAQEEGHRRSLERLQAGDFVLVRDEPKDIEDLHLTDYLREVPLDEHADVQQVLIVAGKREAGSYELYNALADIAEDKEAIKLFRFLANQELEHKQRIERLYDDMFYTEV